MKRQKNKIYKVRESETSITYWHYLVEAKNKTQAIELLHSGDANCYKKTENIPIKVYTVSTSTAEDVVEYNEMYGGLE